MKPARSILYWKPNEYVPAIKTDLRAKFAKIREQQEQQQARERAGITSINTKRKQG